MRLQPVWDTFYISTVCTVQNSVNGMRIYTRYRLTKTCRTIAYMAFTWCVTRDTFLVVCWWSLHCEIQQMTIGQNLNVTRLSVLMIISQSTELTSYYRRDGHVPPAGRIGLATSHHRSDGYKKNFTSCSRRIVASFILYVALAPQVSWFML